MELPTQPQPGLPPASTKPEIAPVVSAIVRRGDSAKALIDGRVVGIGDEVLPGWIIEHIDVREQVVTLRNAAGKQRELSGKRGPAGPSK